MTDTFEKEVSTIKKRSLYNVFCDAVLVNVVGKETDYPRLVDDDYQFTQGLGKHLRERHHTGLISPSARRKQGVNYNIFQQNVLRDPEMTDSLTYDIDLVNNVALIKIDHAVIFSISI